MNLPLPWFRCSASAALALLLLAAPAHAASTYFDNLDQPVEDVAGLDNGYAVAQSFLTDNSAPVFALNFVMLSMAAGNATGGNFTVSLYADNASKPGSLVETLTGNSTPLLAGNYSYTSAITILSPNTLYWVVATSNNTSGDYNWNYTNSLSVAGTWTTSGWSESFDQGSSWSLIDPTAPQMMAISAIPIPEPAMWALAPAAIALALVVARRRRK